MTPPASSPWEALRAGFRRVCVLRLVGDEEGAVKALKNEIPSLVVGWVKTSSLEPAEKKAKLKEVFDDESSRAEELATAFELFAAKFEAKVAARVADEVSKAREEMFTVASKFEQALEGFLVKFEQLLVERQAMSSAPVASLPKEEEPEAKSLSEPELVPEAELEPKPQLVPEAELEPELEPNVKPDPEPAVDALETVGTGESDPEPEPDPEPVLEPEPEPVPEPLVGIRFDDIEGMIDELLAQGEG
ncbi:MAG: hypothetical protein VB997_07560 [Opitutales bacterium]